MSNTSQGKSTACQAVFLSVFLTLFTAASVGAYVFVRGDASQKVVAKKKVKKSKKKEESKFKKAWEPTEELVAHGKTLFSQQCASCHGANGDGNGPAAAALVPHPRNFHSAEGWVNGRKPSHIFKTLKEGIAGSSMASYSSLSQEDRWALTHYVASLGPDVLKDTESDLIAVGVDPSKESSDEEEAPMISVRFAIQRMEESGGSNLAQPEVQTDAHLKSYNERLKTGTFSKQPFIE